MLLDVCENAVGVAFRDDSPKPAAMEVDLGPGSKMSALGQKQTCAAQEGMSASPPVATAKADIVCDKVRIM
ncbi:MAG: hypothetical protein WBX78_15345, partial [Pseudolabrys sp.]